MRHQQKTLDKILSYRARGYTIVEGNNPRLNTRQKYRNFHCVRLAQTNSRRHGRCINTVWAIKPR